MGMPHSPPTQLSIARHPAPRPSPVQPSDADERAAVSTLIAPQAPPAAPVAVVATLLPSKGANSTNTPLRTPRQLLRMPYRLPPPRQGLSGSALRSPSVFAIVREHAQYNLRPSPRRVQRLRTLIDDEDVDPYPAIAALFVDAPGRPSRADCGAPPTEFEPSPFAPPDRINVSTFICYISISIPMSSMSG